MDDTGWEEPEGWHPERSLLAKALGVAVVVVICLVVLTSVTMDQPESGWFYVGVFVFPVVIIAMLVLGARRRRRRPF